MATKRAKKASTSKKRSTSMNAIQRTRSAMSHEARVAYGDIQQAVKHLERSIVEIRRSALSAERKIEGDARARIRQLRKEARVQLSALRSTQREAGRTLKSLSAAAGDSWRELKDGADSILRDARATAAAVIERFRSALTS